MSLLMRNGYSWYALYVTPPPHGFSQASFSSNSSVRSPALARRSAEKAPAGPPPSTATVFTAYPRPADVRGADWVIQTEAAVMPARHADLRPGHWVGHWSTCSLCDPCRMRS